MFFLFKQRIRIGLASRLCDQVLFRMNSTQFIEKNAVVRGSKLHYIKAGEENGRNAVLLMPGALGSGITDFKPQINDLPKLLPNYTVIAWDPPGYGQSIPPIRQFTKDFFTKDADYAVELMKTIGYDAFSILGWSDGGITGMVLAAKYPPVVEKLVIWGSNAYIIEKETKIYESIRDVSNWSPRMREPMEKMYGAENFARLWSDWVDIFLKLYREDNGEICSRSLHKILCPTFILHGLKDPMIAEEHTDHLRKNIAITEYFEFKDGKHNIHLRYADEFNKQVAAFLQKDFPSKSKI
ncbi:hypothetical protein HA402_010586 [Bradysia odoriphaga]|nr:hypothetical protein HA402_010586 [Bradysia odoriphaga]